MSFADLRRRLDRIEANRGCGAPTMILSSHPRPVPGEPGELAGALENWRDWVTDGRASVDHGVLWIGGPELTMEEWKAKFCTEH